MTTAADDNVAWWNVHTPPNTYERLSRCQGKGCISRRRSGPDFYCSFDCLPAEMQAEHYQRQAAAYNAANGRS